MAIPLNVAILSIVLATGISAHQAVFAMPTATSLDAPMESILKANAENHPVIANGSHATHLIQNYIKMHPVKINAIEKKQDNTITELNRLQQLTNKRLAQKLAKAQPQQAVLPKVFPVRSPELTPGKVVSKRIHVTLPEPIFIVGSDARSKSWLEQYQKRLLQLHAKGYVINVSTQDAMNALVETYPHLSLMATPGDSIGKNLRLKHYPVLISDNLIEQ